MKLSARPGYCFVTPDSPVETAGKFGLIIMPNKLRHYPRTGFVHLHCLSSSWDEVDLTGKRVIFDRWSGKPFTLKWSDGKEYTFYSVSQWAVLAVLTTEPFICPYCKSKGFKPSSILPSGCTFCDGTDPELGNGADK